MKEPDSLSANKIPEDLKYLEGKIFVFSEKDFNNQKIIFLGTVSSLKLLSEADCWLMDGTFNVVPSIMRQLFSIHGKIKNEIVPLIFCIMSTKTKEAYYEMFYELCLKACEYNINLNPSRIISDFEKGSVAAAKNFFPTSEYKGCFFHLGQIIWRKVQSEGLSKEYGNSEEFSLQIRMIKTLAFITPDEIPTYFEELYKNLNNDARNIAKWF